jgi:hypothetical protein
MLDSMIPIIRQLHDADGDRARAQILLRVDDATLLKFHPVFAGACRKAGFEPGVAFVEIRIACMHAVRSTVGGLPGGLALAAETLRAELAAFAAGAPIVVPPSSVASLDI